MSRSTTKTLTLRTEWRWTQRAISEIPRFRMTASLPSWVRVAMTQNLMLRANISQKSPGVQPNGRCGSAYQLSSGNHEDEYYPGVIEL